MVTFLDGGDPVITGTETMTKPGGFQFGVTGGNGPYTWSVTGTGATIDQDGYVSLDNSACGSFTVTCTDCTGRSISHVGTRVTNNGTWVGCDVGCYYNPARYSCFYLLPDTDVYSGNMHTTTHICYAQGAGNSLASPCIISSYGVDCISLYTCSPVCGREYSYVGSQIYNTPPYYFSYSYTCSPMLVQYRWWICA